MAATTVEPESIDVSVIMPVFNGERYVEAAIESVLHQNNVSLELIVRDDGSEDGTLVILQRCAQKDNRVKVAAGPNVGPAACRNLCLSLLSGTFVAFLDHDDLWPQGRLHRQLEFLRSRTDSKGVLGETLIFEEVDATGFPATDSRTRRVFAGLLQAGLFRHSFLEQIGLFDPSLVVADDFDLLLRMVETGHRIDAEPHLAVYYRMHCDQQTADLRFTGRQTAQAVSRSLRRRRALQLTPAALRPLER